MILCIPCLVFAQAEMELELAVNKTEISVGEDFQLALILRLTSANRQNGLSRVPISGIEKFQQIGSSNSTKINVVNGKSAIISENMRTLIASEEGEFTFGPVFINVQDPTGKKTQINSNTVSIKVIKEGSVFTSNGSMEKVSDDEFVETSFFSISRNQQVFLVFFVIGTFVALLIWLYRKNAEQKRLIAQKKSNELPPVKVSSLPTVNDENFYGKLQEIILKFVSQEKRLDLKGKTSEEVLDCIQKEPYFADVVTIINACDAARYSGLESDREIVLELARHIINEEN